MVSVVGSEAAKMSDPMIEALHLRRLYRAQPAWSRESARWALLAVNEAALRLLGGENPRRCSATN
jgi:hypothetical protein